jgi:hypothetical protein
VEVYKKHLTTVTPFSYALTLILLIVIPLIFLHIGLYYNRQSIEGINQEIKNDKNSMSLRDFEKVNEIIKVNRLTNLEYRNIQVDLSTIIAT